MKTFTILMDRSRYLTADSYILGVEGDHKIEKIALCLPRFWGETDILSSTVNLHLKAGDDYFYNAVPQDSSYNDEEVVYFFPVTREMTCRNEEVRIEFSFRGNGDTFSFTSRSLELMIATPLVEGEEIESDYPGVLADTLNHIDSLQERLVKTELLLEELDGIDQLESRVGSIEAFLGYSSEDIIGLEADFENSVFTRLAGAKGLEAGEDFNRFSVYRDRVRCNVSDDGTINALYSEDTVDVAIFDADVAATQNTGTFGIAPHITSSCAPAHPTYYGKNMTATVTVGDKEYTLHSAVGLPNTKFSLGTFIDSNGNEIELSTSLFGTINGNVAASYDGYFHFYFTPYTADTVHINLSVNGVSAYADDGSNGQVMVYQPKFYYRVVPIRLEKQEDGFGYHIGKANYYISATPRPGFKLHPAFYDENGKQLDYILLSAYEGSLWDASENKYFHDGVDTDATLDTSADKLCSVSGVKPISGRYKALTRSSSEAVAALRGSGWHIETIQTVAANQLLMAIEFGTFNLQSALGMGIVSTNTDTGSNRACITGSTAVLGNISGEAAETVGDVNGSQTVYTTGSKLAVSYRGVENPWGNIYKFANGVTIVGYGENGDRAKICSDFKFSDAASLSGYKDTGMSLTKKGGYIRRFGFSGEDFDWVFLPTENSNGATSVYPIGDYVTAESAESTGARNFFYGGSWSDGEQSGPFRYHIKNSVAGKYAFCGARLIYLPREAIV